MAVPPQTCLASTAASALSSAAWARRSTSAWHMRGVGYLRFKKWITHKYFPEVDMDKDEFPDMDFCDQEIIQEWIDETNQDFKLVSMPDQKGFYFCEDEYKNCVELNEYNSETGEFWSVNQGKWISTD